MIKEHLLLEKEANKEISIMGILQITLININPITNVVQSDEVDEPQAVKTLVDVFHNMHAEDPIPIKIEEAEDYDDDVSNNKDSVKAIKTSNNKGGQ